jgi:hypothetical protein
VARLEAEMQQDAFSGASLGGAQLSPAAGGVVLDRDRGAVSGRADGSPGLPTLLLCAGVETVWDGRLAVTASMEGVAIIADSPAPRFSVADGKAPPVVTARWLIADHAAHALAAASD